MVVAQEGSLLSVLSSVATTALKNQLSTEDNHNENTVFDPNSKAGEKQAGVFGMTRRCNFLKFLAGGTRTQLLPCPSPRDEELVVIKTTEQELSEAERMISMEIYNLSKVPDHFLLWTLTTSFFHIIQALLMFLIAIAASDSDNRWYWDYSIGQHCLSRSLHLLRGTPPESFSMGGVFLYCAVNETVGWPDPKIVLKNGAPFGRHG
ncbi:hypothetical protein ACA910_002167 [Epithemia clementina (nom. ined.)]